MSIESSYIPESFRNTFTALEAEVIDLFFKQIYFDQLFGEKSAVVTINDAAPQIFHYIQMSMIYDIILSISRLTDPARSFGRKNLSLLALKEEVDDVELKEEVSNTVLKLEGILDSLRDWRNKKLAHNDHSHHTSGVRLAAVNRGDLTEASKVIGACLNVFHKKYGDTTVAYEMAITEKDGDSLLFYLRYGLLSWERDKAAHNMEIVHKMKNMG